MPDPAPPAAPPAPPARFDLHVIFETLRGGKAIDSWLNDWLTASYESPAAFREALYAYVSARRRGMKSRLGKAYDLYHDCVVANLGGRRTALVVCESGALEEISFETLHDRCTALSAAWKKAGVEPGGSVCLVLPVGADQAVALLTALRMGLVVSMVPPLGPTYVGHRIEALEPDRIVTTERLRNALRLPAQGVLPLAGTTTAGAPPSCSYQPGEAVLRLLSPFSELGADPIEVPASALHASIVRDGLLVLGLDNADVLAAPAFDPVQFQPHLLLSVLVSGAGFAELSVKDLARDPRLVERARVTVLGIGRDMRELIIERGADMLKASVRAWFRSLTEVLDVYRWDELRRLFEVTKLIGFNVVANAATGGVELFSPRAAAPWLRVYPVPARSFKLSEVGTGVLLALDDAGIYTPVTDDEPEEGHAQVLLARRETGPQGSGLPAGGRQASGAQEGGFIFAGTIDLGFTGTFDLGPDAHAYPRDEVSRVVAAHPGVRHATVVLVPGRWMNDARVVLIVFVDDARGPDGRIALPVGVPELEKRILREMGERFVPERVEIFPLRPRFDEDGELDHAWCRSQYLSGMLTKRARLETFILLSRIGYILAGGAPRE
jgi:hypothetical protein